MNIYTDIPHPRGPETGMASNVTTLQNHGLLNLKRVLTGTSPPRPVRGGHLPRRRPRMARRPFIVHRKHTARAAGGKFVVVNPLRRATLGQCRRSRRSFNSLLARLQSLPPGDRDIFVQDCFGGADPDYRHRVRHHRNRLTRHGCSPAPCFGETMDGYRKHVPGIHRLLLRLTSPMTDSARTGPSSSTGSGCAHHRRHLLAVRSRRQSSPC